MATSAKVTFLPSSETVRVRAREYRLVLSAPPPPPACRWNMMYHMAKNTTTITSVGSRALAQAGRRKPAG